METIILYGKTSNSNGVQVNSLKMPVLQDQNFWTFKQF